MFCSWEFWMIVWLMTGRNFFTASAVNTDRGNPLSGTMKVWAVPKGTFFGSLDRLHFRYVPISQATNDKVRVSTRAIGLNFADIFCLLGLYQAANLLYDKKQYAFVPGLEFCGIVEHDPTNTFQKGQRVMGFTLFGAYSDIVQVPHSYLLPLPTVNEYADQNKEICAGAPKSHWTFLEGASFLVQALTAWHGLVTIGGMPNLKQMQREENAAGRNNDSNDYIVLVHSAAGGTGLWASEIAARRGATVIGVVGSNEKADLFLRRILPLSPKSGVILRGDERTFGKRLQSTLKIMYPNRRVGFDLVMESLGGKYFTGSLNSLRRNGILVTFGSTSYVSPGLGKNIPRLLWKYINRPRVDPGILTSRNIRVAGFNLIYLTDQPKQLRQELDDCIRCLSETEGTNIDIKDCLAHVTPPLVGNVFDFSFQTVKALECLKSGTTAGKVVLDNSENRAV